MTLDRRHLLRLAIAANVAVPARALAQASSAEGQNRELRGVFEQADKLSVGGPRAAGGDAALDLAEIVDDALARSADEDAAVLASRAGLLLSQINRDLKDGSAVEFPTPAAPRRLTDELRREYTELFSSAKVLDANRAELTKVARFITSERARGRYRSVAAQTGVPWFLVGAIHYREANLNFMGHLHNGDPLLMRTVQVPANRPAPVWPRPGLDLTELWQVSAIDALRRFSTVTRWTLPDMCYLLEAYNGFGCRDHGIHSPYLWNYTQHYAGGGFPRDHFFSPEYRSKQAGLISVLLALREIAAAEVQIEL